MPKDLPRFYCEQLTPPELALSADEAHHAMNVMRLTAGCQVVLFDGQGRWAQGEVVHASRREVRVSLGPIVTVAGRRCEVHMGFAVPKGKRLDWLLEKTTELGAASLQAVRLARSVAGAGEFDSGKQHRWQVHCIAAAKQSGLNYLPDLREPADLPEFVGQAGGTLAIVGDLSPSAGRLSDVLPRRRQGQPVTILVGPEGGLTDEESQAASQAGFVPVRLGQTTLRVETAAIALLAATIAMCE